ncbi:MAG: hypothetical protein SOY37_07100 [Oscillospiraceae bacterium]|nr:hypothetical protein [Oscillospiraceae bacterium]
MKFRKHLGMILTVAVTALVFTCVGAYAASNYGSQSDPLVTVSYLTKTLQPTMESEFDNTVTSAMTELEKQFESELTGEFAVVSVASGKTLKCNTGCEVLFRSGTAKAVGSGLLDTTDGAAVTEGKAMTANHLYMASADGSGFTASSAVTVLVRGTYTIG